MKERTYICCDLKSFYASVECIERGLNPLDTNLVVADLSRTEKTICLAVTPSLKSYGISGRARLFEVIQRVKEVNNQRQRNTPGRQFTGASSHDPEVRRNPSLALDYIVAPPRMAHYIDWSTRVYSVYLKHVAPEDIYPYSIDEVFIDATSYLQTYHLSAREFARKIILDILQTTGITAAAGIGTNLYLAKVAMDIGAKHVPADEYGVRIAELDEMAIAAPSGPTVRSPTSGGWEKAMPPSWKPTACTPWEILPGVLSGSLQIITTRNCSINCLVSTRNCSSTMPGAGNPAPLRTLRHTNQKTRASSPGRSCSTHTHLKRQGWSSRRWPMHWRWNW